jgi:MFS family permease
MGPMSTQASRASGIQEHRAGGRLAGLGLLALVIMAPVTMPVPILRELVQDRFVVSEFLTSLFMSVNMMGGFLAAPLAGAVADRFGHRKRLLVGALFADAIFFFALTLPVTFSGFLAIRFLEGCAHITALSVLLTLASNAFPEQYRGRAMGLVGGGMMLGIALGAPIGGLLGKSDTLMPLRVGAMMLVVAGVVAMLVVREGHSDRDKPSYAAILASLRAKPIILAPLAFAFTDRFTVGFFTTTFALYLRRIYDLGPSEIGALIATFMIPFAVFSYPFGRIAEKRSPIAMLAVGSLLYGLGTAMVGFTGPPELSFLMFATGVAAAVMFVPSMLLTIQVVGEEVRSTALGAFNAAGSLGFILGPLVGGGVSQLVAARSDWLEGYRTAFIVAGISEVLCVAIALPLLWRVSQRAAGRGVS